jgi:tRNA-binding protein
VRADPFPEARKPAYKLTIDFGSAIGLKQSSAQLTERYDAADLAGRLIVAVVNFAPRQIGPLMSDVLTLGVPDGNGAVVLLAPDAEVPLGAKIF